MALLDAQAQRLATADADVAALQESLRAAHATSKRQGLDDNVRQLQAQRELKSRDEALLKLEAKCVPGKRPNP